MKLAIGAGFATGRAAEEQIAYIKEAEKLGYESVWVPEIYGPDAPTTIAYIAAWTDTIKLGTSIMQMFGRTPANTAMVATALDAMSNGRFILGLGLSGPQVVEGWYGQRYVKPLQYTREYVEIVRQIIRREPLDYKGEIFQFPLPDSQGKALKLISHPVRDNIPIYLASIGPKNLELTGEIADGWIPAFYSPDHMDKFLPHIEKGAKKAGRSIGDIDIHAGAGVIVTDDVEAGLNMIKPGQAFYIGGMGSKKDNFYNNLAHRYGYGEAAEKVQELFLGGRREEAIKALPDELVDATNLVGPPERIAERAKRYEAAGVTTLAVQARGRSIEERVQVLGLMKDIFS